jgi:uroporphyrinogen-III synthase
LKVKSILVTQPKPESDKSPYFDLAKKYSLKIDFREFIHVEGIQAKDFRKDKINIIESVSKKFKNLGYYSYYKRDIKCLSLWEKI